jgi:twinkle protein
MSTLIDLLAERGIRPPKALRADQEQRLDCPTCCPGKPHPDNADSLCLHVDADGAGATWNCKRGSCGWSGGVHLPRMNGGPDWSGGPQAARPRPQRPPPPPPPEVPVWFTAFWDDRKIGPGTLKRLGVYAGRRYFPSMGGEHDCIVFPYVHKGQLVGAKYRAIAQKQHSQDAPKPPTLFNADSIKPGCTLYWSEGEPDVCAVEEVGREHGHVAVVSLKDGAPAKAGDNNDKRLAALETHKDALAKVKLHIIATDADAPGEALAEELVRRLGRHKCRRWKPPEGCKDACDVLRQYGAPALWQSLQDAEPYPIEGIRSIPDGYLRKLRDRPLPPVMTTGTRCLDLTLKLPMDGRLIVLTGLTNFGKSSWIRHTMVHTARTYGRKWLALVAEDDFDDSVAECGAMFNQRSIYDSDDAALDQANDLLKAGIKFVECDTEDNPPTVDLILQRAEEGVMWGMTDLMIDPWNELDHQRGSQSETDYVGRALQRLRGFANRHGANVWILAHPAKLSALESMREKRPPDGYSISGSAHFSNKCDLGLTIHRLPENEAELSIWKSRQRRWGVKDSKVKMRFDPRTFCFSDPPQADWEAPPNRNNPPRED